MMVSLYGGCILLNAMLACNLAHMSSRAVRAKGTATCVHKVALMVSVIAILQLVGMIVLCYYPTQVKIYRYLQDSYFAL